MVLFIFILCLLWTIVGFAVALTKGKGLEERTFAIIVAGLAFTFFAFLIFLVLVWIFGGEMLYSKI